jgi:pimeloyl-ACP methyl ester carboxylesterase
MAHNDDFHQAKIGAEFAARLARRKPQQKVRAIVLLGTDVAGETPARRQSRAEQQTLIEARRKSAEPALIEIDKTLARHDGKRLATSISTLGTVPLETTAAGIKALATSQYVKAILEDQAISLLAKPSQP